MFDISNMLAYFGTIPGMMMPFNVPVDINSDNIIASGYEDVDVFAYTRPIVYDALSQRLSELISLSPDWDGYGAVVPDIATYTTAIDFLKKIDQKTLSYLDEDDIVPTPYGTIVLDFANGQNLVSIEIGENKIGFFTEFSDGKNSESEGDVWMNIVSEKLSAALNRLDSCLN